ncbi:hypothetical protein C6P46_005137 [Rhodotorula mucilaginosa]|uniref:Uncharacterized protein n=1 Tax=Rhodotorula mucilaginosa TaxID=5537 RepID=A0A9P7B4W0_RHOMI|nr:hypothetical protein C6P46_005137 [Rhodotorula mucilaginosa]
MLERLPTELISLVIDATSTGAWERKALLDSLSLVSKSYRIALRPLRESIVHVPRAAIIPLLRLWPAATRKAADTVFIGSSDQAAGLEPFSLRDYSRLLSILPKIKHIYFNPFKRTSITLGSPTEYLCFDNTAQAECLSLSLLQSQWQFLPSLETARFKLRRLRLDLVLADCGPGSDKGWGAGLEQFLTTRYLPCLRILRLLCRQTPKISTDFVNQLDAAQIDFCRPSDVESSGVRQIGPFSTPVLFSIDTPSFFPFLGPKVECMKYVHVQSQDGWEVNRLLRILPGLKAVSWETSDPRASIQALESPDHPFPELTKQNIKRKSIGLFAAGLGDDDFVDFAFLRFLDSCEPRS